MKLHPRTAVAVLTVCIVLGYALLKPKHQARTEVADRGESSLQDVSASKSDQASQDSDSPEQPPSQVVADSLNREGGDVIWRQLGPASMLVITPIGPCGTIAQLAPDVIGFNTGIEADRSLHIFSTWNNAYSTAAAYCSEWYSNEKASREIAFKIGAAWQQNHPVTPQLDLKQPLFTTKGSLGCPTWAALLYAASAREHHWTYAGALAGVEDPAPNLTLGDQISPATYDCDDLPDRTPLTLIDEKPPSGSALRSSLGWVLPSDLQN